MNIKNRKKINRFIFLLIILAVMLPNINWADSWKKTILSTEKSLDDLFLTIYVISPDNNWLIFLPDIYKEMNFISINLRIGKEMPTRGYNDPFEKRKDFKWTIFWRSENEAVLRKKWRHEVAPNKWETEEQYYTLNIHENEVVVHKLQTVPDKDIKFVDLYSERDAFEFFETYGSSRVALSSRHPEISFKKTWLNSLIFYYDGNFVAEHNKRFVINIFLPTFQKPGFNGLAISPDNKYIFYGISWSGGDWNVGPRHLYLLDIEKKHVSLIDEHYDSSTPEFMVWTMDSKKFIYRRYNEKNQSSELKLITFLE